ncbi:MAG TPA: hypothetical protein V6D35_17530 [Candidatus Sericytochromatia bacterium]|jgi:hypothetical protein
MLNFNRLQSRTATLLTVLVTSTAVVPLLTTGPVFAQSNFPQRERLNRERLNLVVPSGTSIPVRYDKEKIVVMPDETMPVTLTVAADVISSEGRVVIPQGSQISGELQPVSGGSQFVAREITLFRRRVDEQSKPFSISGRSNVVRRIEEVKKGASTTSILTGAAVGGGAAAALAAITGDRALATEEILGGAGLGALGGFFLNRQKVDAVVIYPERDLTVRLNSQFSLR